MDNKTPVERSRNMAAVRSKNTTPEVRLRKALWAKGLRYFTSGGWKKLTGRRLPGSPDLIFPGAHVAVFVDGCFWHGCPLHYTAPAANREFWENKLRINILRDAKVDSELLAQGWQVLRLWEHDTTKTRLSAAVEAVLTAAANGAERKGSGHGDKL